MADSCKWKMWHSHPQPLPNKTRVKVKRWELCDDIIYQPLKWYDVLDGSTISSLTTSEILPDRGGGSSIVKIDAAPTSRPLIRRPSVFSDHFRIKGISNLLPFQRTKFPQIHPSLLLSNVRSVQVLAPKPVKTQPLFHLPSEKLYTTPIPPKHLISHKHPLSPSNCLLLDPQITKKEVPKHNSCSQSLGSLGTRQCSQ